MTSTLLPVLHQTKPLAPIPASVLQAGPAATFAWDEYFSGMIRNRHTKASYLRAVTRFLKWIEPDACPLERVTPGMIGRYMDELPLSATSRKVHLAAIRSFFDVLTVRHVVVMNPAHSVRGERISITEGVTPEISLPQVRALLASIDTSTLLGKRDKAIIACLLFTAARAGAVASLTRGSFQHDGTQYRLRFLEKGGKRRDIPVRSDLEIWLLDYLAAAGLSEAAPTSPLFRSASGKSGRLTGKPITGVDVCRLVKRRLAEAGLPTHLSPHSFRVAAASDLLRQSVPLEDVQFLLGHSDSRTTQLYDRRQRSVTRNIVERISA